MTVVGMWIYGVSVIILEEKKTRWQLFTRNNDEHTTTAKLNIEWKRKKAAQLRMCSSFECNL